MLEPENASGPATRGRVVPSSRSDQMLLRSAHPQDAVAHVVQAAELGQQVAAHQKRQGGALDDAEPQHHGTSSEDPRSSDTHEARQRAVVAEQVLRSLRFLRDELAKPVGDEVLLIVRPPAIASNRDTTGSIWDAKATILPRWMHGNGLHSDVFASHEHLPEELHAAAMTHASHDAKEARRSGREGSRGIRR